MYYNNIILSIIEFMALWSGFYCGLQIFCPLFYSLNRDPPFIKTSLKQSTRSAKADKYFGSEPG